MAERVRTQGTTNHAMFRFTLRLLAVSALAFGALLVATRLGAKLGLDLDFFALAAFGGFMLALAALALAASAWRSARLLRRDLLRIVRSVDHGLGGLLTQSDRTALSIEALDAALSREIAMLRRHARERDEAEQSRPADDDAEPVIPEGGNVVAYPAIRRNRQNQPPPQPQSTPARASIEAACRRAVDEGTFELSLQPIVSVETSSAVAFDAYAHLPLGDGQSLDIQRLPDTMSAADRASFERMLLLTTAEVTRRRLGDGNALPVHVPVSGALLGDSDALAAALELFSLYPALANSVLLSVPAADVAGAAPEMLASVADHGLRIAQEGWNANADGRDLRRRNVAVAKVSADRLLGRDKNADDRGAAISILEIALAAGIAVIATDVRSDEDAVNLIDLGIETMSGTRFSGPKRLKPESARDRIATP